KGTAEWCGPCKMMERDVFTDQRVIDWFEQHAVAVALDVDEMPGLAKRLRIHAMPTLILFQGRTELDRHTGYMDANAFLAWVEGERTGNHVEPTADTNPVKERAIHEYRAEAEKGNVAARYGLAIMLRDEGRFDEALDEYVTMWQIDTKDVPELIGFRTGLLPSEMRVLAQEYEPAREQFERMRDELSADAREPGPHFDGRTLLDWLCLDQAIGGAESIRWADRTLHDAEFVEQARPYLYPMHSVARSMNRLDILGQTYVDPVVEAQRPMDEVLEREQSEGPASVAVFRKYTRESGLPEIYSALLAANRDDEAADTAEAIFAVWPDAQMRTFLITAALTANEPRPIHLQWIDDMATPDATLRERVKVALEEADESG
ncbi:MAG: thioredoxin family protein, partial [Planctomycetota bacterium]